MAANGTKGHCGQKDLPKVLLLLFLGKFQSEIEEGEPFSQESCLQGLDHFLSQVVLKEGEEIQLQAGIPL